MPAWRTGGRGARPEPGAAATVLILSVAAPRTGSSRFGQLLQSMKSAFVCEPFHPTAYIHCAKGPSGLRFYDKAPYDLSEFGRDMVADSLIKGILPSRALRMQSVPRRTASHLHQTQEKGAPEACATSLRPSGDSRRSDRTGLQHLPRTQDRQARL